MELFRMYNDPTRYFAFDRSVATNGSKARFFIYASGHFFQVAINMQDSMFYPDESARVKLHTNVELLYRGAGKTAAITKFDATSTYGLAPRDDPVWELMYKTCVSEDSSHIASEWTDVDDALVRGWTKDLVLLCKALPNRTYNEIVERKKFVR